MFSHSPDSFFHGLSKNASSPGKPETARGETFRPNGSGATQAGADQPPAAEPTDDLDQAIDQVQVAIVEFMNGRPATWKAICSHLPDATLFGAWGAYERGWSELGPRYDWAAARFAEGHVTFEELGRHVSGDLACVVHLERAQVRLVTAGEPATMTLRVTLILRREDTGWKLVHRHADALTTILPPASVIEQ